MENSVAIAPPSLKLALAAQRALAPSDDDALDRLFKYLERSRPTMREIKTAICEFYGITAPELVGGSRLYEISLARQIFCFLAYRHTRFAMHSIGVQVGITCHTTVLHAIRKIEKWAITRPLVADDLDLLRLRISEKVLLRCEESA